MQVKLAKLYLILCFAALPVTLMAQSRLKGIGTGVGVFKPDSANRAALKRPYRLKESNSLVDVSWARLTFDSRLTKRSGEIPYYPPQRYAGGTVDVGIVLAGIPLGVHASWYEGVQTGQPFVNGISVNYEGQVAKRESLKSLLIKTKQLDDELRKSLPEESFATEELLSKYQLEQVTEADLPENPAEEIGLPGHAGFDLGDTSKMDLKARDLRLPTQDIKDDYALPKKSLTIPDRMPDTRLDSVLHIEGVPRDNFKALLQQRDSLREADPEMASKLQELYTLKQLYAQRANSLRPNTAYSNRLSIPSTSDAVGIGLTSLSFDKLTLRDAPFNGVFIRKRLSSFLLEGAAGFELMPSRQKVGVSKGWAFRVGRVWNRLPGETIVTVSTIRPFRSASIDSNLALSTGGQVVVYGGMSSLAASLYHKILLGKRLSLSLEGARSLSYPQVGYHGQLVDKLFGKRQDQGELVGNALLVGVDMRVSGKVLLELQFSTLDKGYYAAGMPYLRPGWSEGRLKGRFSSKGGLIVITPWIGLGQMSDSSTGGRLRAFSYGGHLQIRFSARHSLSIDGGGYKSLSGSRGSSSQPLYGLSWLLGWRVGAVDFTNQVQCLQSKQTSRIADNSTLIQRTRLTEVLHSKVGRATVGLGFAAGRDSYPALQKIEFGELHTDFVISIGGGVSASAEGKLGRYAKSNQEYNMVSGTLTWAFASRLNASFGVQRRFGYMVPLSAEPQQTIGKEVIFSLKLVWNVM